MSVNFRQSRCLLALLVASWLLGLAAPVQATPALREKLAEAAQEIKKILASKNENSVTVGQFTAPAQLAASAGPALSRILAEELRHVQVTVKSDAKYSVEGRYKTGFQPGNREVVAIVLLNLRVLDADDDEIGKVKCVVLGQETVAHVFGLNVQLTPAAPAERRNAALEAALTRPAAYVDGSQTRVAANPESPYAVEVLIPDKPLPRPVTVREGHAYVRLGPRDEYQIRLHNDSNLDAVALVAVDGLQVFSFSKIRRDDGQPKYSRIIVPKKSAITIKGWHIDNQETRPFRPSIYPEPTLARANPGNVGTITATFAATWPKGESPPADEQARAGLETGTGTRVELGFREVQRTFGIVRAAVTVRFER